MLSDNEVKIKFDKLSNKLQAGQFTEVINETLTLLKKRQHQVFFNILSIAYQSIGEFQKSSDVMEDALRMNPNNPFFLNNMGISQHKLENFNKAEEYFNRGLKIAPNYINIDDESCSTLRVDGCTDSSSCVYNPDANHDDGSCIFESPQSDFNTCCLNNLI